MGLFIQLPEEVKEKIKNEFKEHSQNIKNGIYSFKQLFNKLEANKFFIKNKYEEELKEKDELIAYLTDLLQKRAK